LSITHSKVSAVADSGDSSLVQPSDWNADHVVSLTLDDLSNVSASAPTNGQVLKYNGSAWVPDTDNATTGTGILSSGSGAPSGGSDGEYYLQTSTGLIWGPKASGSWPTYPIKSSNYPFIESGSAAINHDGFTREETDMNTALAAHGHVVLQAGNKADADGANYSSNNQYVIGGTVLTKRYGSMRGENAWLLAASPDFQTGTAVGDFAVPMLSWTSASNQALGDAQWLHWEGIHVTGNRIVGGNDNIIGFSAVGLNSSTGNYDRGPVHIWMERLFATNCYIGYHLGAMQYGHIQGCKTAQCEIGFLHQSWKVAGGMIDMPNMEGLDAEGNADNNGLVTASGGGVGHLFVAGFAAANFGYHLRGPVAKHVATGFAFVWDSSVTADIYNEMILDSPSTEFNSAGSYGESTTDTYTIPRVQYAGTNDTIDIEIPRVELYIEKNWRVRVRNAVWASGYSGAGIGALLDGPDARLVIEDSDFPSAYAYQVRCTDQSAAVEYAGPVNVPSGIVENVEVMPTGFRVREDGAFGSAGVYTGFAGMEQYSNLLVGATYGLHSSWTTLAPDFSNSTGGITVATVTDPIDGGTVTKLTFPNNTTDIAKSKYLGGYGSAQAYGSAAFAVTNFELYDASGAAVRLILYLTTGGSYSVGCDPSAAAGTIPEAITLWPGAWQRVSIVWNKTTDSQIWFSKLSSSATTDIYVRRIANFRADYTQRGLMNHVLHRGLWKSQ
jgi:hypothetical protein